jgi:hypothetical protein
MRTTSRRFSLCFDGGGQAHPSASPPSCRRAAGIREIAAILIFLSCAVDGYGGVKLPDTHRLE